MKIQKKHIVMAALILALGTAVYINTQIAGSSTENRKKELGAVTYVNANVSNSTKDEAVKSPLTKEQENYFARERTKRQTTQAEVIEQAQKFFELDTPTQEQISESQKNVEKIIEYFTTQDTIETIVKAKGFSDCLCCITDLGVTVIVPSSQLNETTALSVYDAVNSHYKCDSSSISVIGA